ncbi:MAG: hypothetical protein ACYC8S_01400 [Minisyncoccota bacterium]
MPELTYIYKPFPDIFFRNEFYKNPPPKIQEAVLEVKKAIRAIPGIRENTDIICMFHSKNSNEIIVGKIVITDERGENPIDEKWGDAGAVLQGALKKLCFLVNVHDQKTVRKVRYAR